MTTLAFDGSAGASGDLVLGALLAAGADRDALAPVEAALPVHYEVGRETDAGIEATRVRVRHEGEQNEGDGDGEGDGDEAVEDRHSHDDHDHGQHGQDHHGHDHGDSGHEDGDHDGHGHGESDHEDDGHDHHHDDHAHDAEGHGPHRSYEAVLEILDDMALPSSVAETARSIFERLGRAEASVHGTDLEATQFHEVGADDAIADVVGVALLLDDLDVDRVVTTPVRAGGGEVRTSHGIYPVPTPATVAIVEHADWELVGGPVDRELLTPTGAAILCEVAEGVERLPSLRVTASGYGTGSYDLGDRPNVLRAVVGEERSRLRREEITVLETNVDDVAPEVLGDLQASLAEVGAKDVTVVPTTMKKARPGHLVKVIADPADAERIARRLAEETGTLGVREAVTAHRWAANRRFESATVAVDGETHEVAVKVATDADGAVLDVSAEYDDAAAVARETGLAMREVARRAETDVHDRLEAADDR